MSNMCFQNESFIFYFNIISDKEHLKKKNLISHFV